MLGEPRPNEEQSASATFRRRNTHPGIALDRQHHTGYRSPESGTETTLSYTPPLTEPQEIPTNFQLTTPAFPITMPTQPTQKLIIPQDFPFFSGNAGDSQTTQPLQWMRRYENIFPAGTNETDLLSLFERVLDPESPAEEWFEELMAGQSAPTTWKQLKQEFRNRWKRSNTETPKRTKKQLLLSTTLAEDDVGRIITEGQRRDEAHLIWADKVEELWKSLGDKEGLCIEDVERGLPKGLVDTMVIPKAAESDWKKWLEAVRTVDVRKAKDRIAELKEREVMREWMERMEQTAAVGNLQAAPYTPKVGRTYQSPAATALQQKMERATLNTTPAQPKSTPQVLQQPTTPMQTYRPPHRRDQRDPPPHPITPYSPFTSQPTNDRNTLPTFYDQTPSPPARRQAPAGPLARIARENSRTYPDTEAGHQQYTRDIEQWEKENGETTQMSFERTYLPLAPGGAPLGSQECWGCGHVGHMLNNAECPITEDDKKTARWMREKGWRSYINKVLHSPNDRTPTRPRTAGIAIIEAEETEFYDPGLYNPEVIAYYEAIQGNGVESRM